MTEAYLAISVLAAVVLMAALSQYIPPPLPYQKKTRPQKVVFFIMVLCFLYVVGAAIATFMGAV